MHWDQALKVWFWFASCRTSTKRSTWKRWMLFWSDKHCLDLVMQFCSVAGFLMWNICMSFVALDAWWSLCFFIKYPAGTCLSRGLCAALGPFFAFNSCRNCPPAVYTNWLGQQKQLYWCIPVKKCIPTYHALLPWNMEAICWKLNSLPSYFISQ